MNVEISVVVAVPVVVNVNEVRLVAVVPVLATSKEYTCTLLCPGYTFPGAFPPPESVADRAPKLFVAANVINNKTSNNLTGTATHDGHFLCP